MIEGCDRTDVEARGWCLLHYSRWRFKGDVSWQPSTVEDRFWEKVDKTETCWLWTGSLCSSGYGNFRDNRVLKPAHRYSYELITGPIPDGKQLDHTCHKNDGSCSGGVTCVHRRCVNPSHLDPVTSQENTDRGLSGSYQRAKTHCPKNHEYTAENTYLAKRRNGKG
jgi:hypothetical protein